MNIKTTLIRLTTLLYFQCKINDSFISPTVITQILSTINNDIENYEGEEKDILKECIQIALEIKNLPKGTSYPEDDFLQRMRIALAGNEGLYNALEKPISLNKTDEEVRKYCQQTAKLIRQQHGEQKIVEILGKATSDLKFRRPGIDNFENYIQQKIGQIEKVFSANADATDYFTYENGFLDLSDEKNLDIVISNVVATSADEQAAGKLFVTGFQAINKMLDGGFRDGELTMILARKHDFKSTMARTIERQIMMYNKVTSRSGKPVALLHIELEDPEHYVVREIIKGILKNDKTLRSDNIEDYTTSELKEIYIKTQSTNGWTHLIKRMVPSETSIIDLMNFIREVNRKYEIRFLTVDFLMKVNDEGLDHLRSEEKIKYKFEVFRDFIQSEGIACLVPHQLSTEANKLYTDLGGKGFVKAVKDRCYYFGCRALGQVTDVELYTSVEHYVSMDQETRAYLVVGQDKHKGFTTPLRYQIATYLLPQDSSILEDDINGIDTSVSRVGEIPSTMENKTEDDSLIF